MRALLLLTLVVAATSSCASVVIVQRSAPTFADQWRAGTQATTVTVPQDARKPIVVKDR